MNLAEKYREYVYYDPTSPTYLRWKKTRPGVSRGAVAGLIVTKEKGRRVGHITLDGKLCQVHRVVWLIFNDELLDTDEIDHRDGDSTNNQIDNLRLATRTLNARNTRMRSNNKTGKTGVFFSLNRGVTATWTATWVDANGEHRTKSFTENVYGDFARLLAEEARDEELGRLTDYTERHGM